MIGDGLTNKQCLALCILGVVLNLMGIALTGTVIGFVIGATGTSIAVFMLIVLIRRWRLERK